MFVALLTCCAIAIQGTFACTQVPWCPFGVFHCTKSPKGRTISFWGEISLRSFTFNAFTLGNGESRGCKVNTFSAEKKGGDMAFVEIETGFGKEQVDCGIGVTKGGLQTISVTASGVTAEGKQFSLRFSFPGHDFGGKDRNYLADIDDPNGIVECFCENGGECVRDEENAIGYCLCPFPYTGRLCTEKSRKAFKDGSDGGRGSCSSCPIVEEAITSLRSINDSDLPNFINNLENILEEVILTNANTSKLMASALKVSGAIDGFNAAQSTEESALVTIAELAVPPPGTKMDPIWKLIYIIKEFLEKLGRDDPSIPIAQSAVEILNELVNGRRSGEIDNSQFRQVLKQADAAVKKAMKAIGSFLKGNQPKKAVKAARKLKKLFKKVRKALKKIVKGVLKILKGIRNAIKNALKALLGAIRG